jgi:hypothetical protein
VYNTATAFEKITTRKPAKKVLNSCRITHQGGELSLLKHYFDRHLADFGVEVPPSELFRLVGDWARDQLEAVGVKVGHPNFDWQTWSVSCIIAKVIAPVVGHNVQHTAAQHTAAQHTAPCEAPQRSTQHGVRALGHCVSWYQSPLWFINQWYVTYHVCMCRQRESSCMCTRMR